MARTDLAGTVRSREAAAQTFGQDSWQHLSFDWQDEDSAPGGGEAAGETGQLAERNTSEGPAEMKLKRWMPH